MVLLIHYLWTHYFSLRFIFYLTRHYKKQFKFYIFLLPRNSFDGLLGKKKQRFTASLIAFVCLCLGKTLLLANDCLASLFTASCSHSSVISHCLWHFHVCYVLFLWAEAKRTAQGIMRLAIRLQMIS